MLTNQITKQFYYSQTYFNFNFNLIIQPRLDPSSFDQQCIPIVIIALAYNVTCFHYKTTTMRKKLAAYQILQKENVKKGRKSERERNGQIIMQQSSTFDLLLLILHRGKAILENRKRSL
eukprot:TRINITY_DN7504_c0_g1_i3.p3 TRINITY_DN7504_c0_g1~~TRINITY_DN7504_c0_g1_i3.p3  ORF type:complete len:119 (-),score=4.58 TRINITY_DN7504_c0_g1_i3:307-663(-)